MSKSDFNIGVHTSQSNRVRQGDIFKNIEFIEYANEKSGVIEISKIDFPLVYILTQDCDLEQDAKMRSENTGSQDKFLISVLVAPIYNVDHFYAGEHLTELNMKMQLIKKDKTPGNDIRNNTNPRYHYLRFPDDLPIVSSIIDFKHYFSVNTRYLESLLSTHFVCSVSDLYREDISHRFASFLSRIGLPEITI